MSRFALVLMLAMPAWSEAESLDKTGTSSCKNPASMQEALEIQGFLQGHSKLAERGGDESSPFANPCSC